MTSLVLPIIVLLPFLVGVTLLVMRRCCVDEKLGETVSVVTACAMLGLSILVSGVATLSTNEVQVGAVIAPRVLFSPDWLSLRLPSMVATNAEGWKLSLGLDGIGITMLMLTAIVTVAVLFVARTTVTHDRSDFGAWILVAASGLMLVFTSMDLISFYVGFELTLIPLYALIALWGDKDAAAAAKRFVLYTLAGSIPMVVGILGISLLYSGDGGWTASLPELSQRAASVASSGKRSRARIGSLDFWYSD